MEEIKYFQVEQQRWFLNLLFLFLKYIQHLLLKIKFFFEKQLGMSNMDFFYCTGQPHISKQCKSWRKYGAIGRM
jgi:hypothetical protein